MITKRSSVLLPLFGVSSLFFAGCASELKSSATANENVTVFSPPSGKAGAYVINTTGTPLQGPVTAVIDGPQGYTYEAPPFVSATPWSRAPLANRNYSYIPVTPGPHVIGTFIETWTRRTGAPTLTLIPCTGLSVRMEPGKNYFFHIKGSKSLPFFNIEQIQEADALRYINACKFSKPIIPPK
jgi:hypothetical protein